MKQRERLLTRRHFLKYLSLTSAGAAIAPLLTPSISFAQLGGDSTRRVKIYVRFYLNGGFDGLYLIPPATPSLFDELKSYRPVLMAQDYLSSASQVLSTGTAFGLHPLLGSIPELTSGGLRSIHDLVQAGQGKIIPKIGPAEPNLNHPDASDFWNVGLGSFDRGSALHWEARLMERAGFDWNQMWLLGEPGGMIPFRRPAGRAPAIQARLLDRVKRFYYPDYDGWHQGSELGGGTEIGAAQSAIDQIMQLPNAAGTPLPKREFKQAMASALNVVDQIAPIINIALPSYFPSWQYPAAIDMSFRDIAKVIKHYRIDQANGNTLMFHIGVNGFDSHFVKDYFGESGYAGGFVLLMRAFNHCVGALEKYLSSLNLWNETIIHFVSEFGRSVRERPGAGTEHGFGNMSLILGGALDSSTGPIVGGSNLLPTAGELGSAPLVGGSYLLNTVIDPRELYWSVIEAMGVDPTGVIDLAPRRSLGLFA